MRVTNFSDLLQNLAIKPQSLVAEKIQRKTVYALMCTIFSILNKGIPSI